jgi:myo-inositol-1(or 4)-monophosphatase
MFGTRSIAAGNEYMLKGVLELVQRPVPRPDANVTSLF